jgi:hypothetical protein
MSGIDYHAGMYQVRIEECEGGLMSPTARTLQFLRKNGFTADVAERFNSFTKQRKDMFGFVDVVAIGGTGGILAIQSTSASNQAARVKKILAEPRAKEWIKSGGKVYVHGWRKKRAKPGGKRYVWVVNEISILEQEFDI